MDLDAIDSLIERYSAAESRIGANLHELANHGTYQILRTDDLSGRTAAKIGPALKKGDRLWNDFGELQSALSRVRNLRGTGRPRGAERKELEQLLTGRSILVSTSDVPLTERDLLASAAAEQRITIDQLLQQMRSHYEPIRDGVALVEETLRRILPRLDAAHTTLGEVSAEAERLGIREPELQEAQRQMKRLRQLSMDDPLAIPRKAGDDFERQVRLAAGRVAEMKKGRDELHGDLGAMGGLIAEVRTLRARAEAAREEAMQKIEAPTGLVRVPPASAIDGPGGLAEASRTLVDGPSGQWQQQRVQVDAWLQRARKLRDQLQRAERSNRSGLDKRDELRGRLTAYRAKMAALGKAEDIQLAELAGEAHDELFTWPTDLVRAERLIGELSQSLTGII